jgi:crossover junction endodeoxyribonuclease RuvC
MIVIGIDPGSASIGYGVLKIINKKISHLEHGLISTSRDLPFPRRLKKISLEIGRLFRKHQPRVIAIESVFFFKNLKTFIPVSRATGVIILEAGKSRARILEFAPPQIKSLIADNGRAEKDEVEKRVKKILGLKKIDGPDDVADALAVALCAARQTLDSRS